MSYHDNKKHLAKCHFQTQQLHAGLFPHKDRNARAVPIYMTTSYVFDSTEHAANLFEQKQEGYTYSRQKNPTTEVFEQRMAMLEGGTDAIATSTGMSALMLAFTAIAGVGHNIVSTSHLYGGTTIQLKYSLKRFGIEGRFVDSTQAEEYEKHIDGNTRCIFIETLGNPNLSIPDIEAIATVSAKHGIPLVIDNTFGGGGYICRPIDWGANVVVHSATKWIGGHGTALAGIVIDAGNFNWNSDKFPNFSKPSPMNKDIVFWDEYGPHTGKNTVLVSFLRREALKHYGPSLSPFNAFLMLLGLETLSLRIEKHCENALELAQYLETHEKVAWVSYPGLQSHASYESAKKYFRKGLFGSMLAFGLQGGETAGKSMVEALQLASHLANVGDAKTLAIHPASTTHNQLSKDEMKATGISPELIRVSVGIEHSDDIIDDFKQALTQIS